MSRTVRLDTLIADVRYRGDFGSATVRHSAANLTRLINQSIQMFRERISDEGSTHYLVPYTGTLGVGPTSPYAFYQLDLSTGPSPELVRTYGVDVTIDGVVHKLDHVPFEARNDYGTVAGGARPLAWAHFRRDQVAILPASSGAYPFTVWYLPKLADLAADSDTFEGVAGWEEWVVWDVVCQAIARDQFPQAYAIAEQRRAEVEQRVIRGATKVTQAGGAHVGRDSFGSKLPHFLGGSRRSQAVAGGPYVPAGGSVTNQMLADMTGPTVKGVMSGTTRPQDVQVATLTTYLGIFNTLQRGLVPPPLGVGQLFLRDDGTWASAGGGGGGGSVGPSGAIQYQAGTGMAGASGFRIHGLSGPSLVAHLDGTFKVTGGQVEVGSGTVRVSASGIDVGGGSIVRVGTLVASAIAAPAFTDTTAGLAPASGGGTTNFLRADGTWQAAGGGGGGGPTMLAVGADGAIQYNGGSGLAGTDFSATVSPYISGSGRAMSWGLTAPSGGLQGGLNWGNATVVWGKTASGARQSIIDWRVAGSAGGIASGAVITYGNVGNPSPSPTGDIEAQRWSVRPSGTFHWFIGPSGLATARLMETGLDVRNFHVAAKSIALATGLGNDQLHPMASGTVKANLGPTGTPSDVSIPTLLHYSPTFTATRPGYVPPSGGGTSNFLRADGAWDVPPGGAASQPSGPAGAVQFRGTAGFDGATGITVVGSGQAFGFGQNVASGGLLRVGNNPGAVLAYRSFSGTSKAAIAISSDGATFDDLNVGDSDADDGNSTLNLGAKLQYLFYIAENPAYQFTNSVANWNSRDLTNVKVAGFQAISIASGLTNANLAPMGSGTVKANLGATGAPSDVPVATFFAAIPTFTSVQRGVVPPSGGGTTNFLRADGTWTTPAAGAAVPSGIDFSVQFNSGGAFGGATGIRVVASGAAFAFGATVAGSGINRFGTEARALVGRRDDGTDAVLMQWGAAANALQIGAGGGAAASIDDLYLDAAPTGMHRTRFGGVTKYEYSGSGADWNLGDLSNVRNLGANTIALASGLTNANLHPIGSGMFKGRISGTGAVQDVSLQTMLAFVPTFTSTQRGVVPPSDGLATSYLAGNGTWSAPSGAAQFPPSGGVQNYQLAPVASGTVKGNLGPSGPVTDISIPTLSAFVPTFTATQRGVVPQSGGGTTNFLRADGVWDVPPGGSASPGGALGNVQFNTGVGFGGATGLNIVASGQALAFGVPSFLPGAGDIRAASGFNITANLPSGIAGVAARQNLLDWSGGGASGVLRVGGASGILGTVREEVATGGSFEWLIGGQTGMALRPTGLDAPGMHVRAKSLDIGHINGLPFDFNGLKRGLDIGNSSGLPSGLSLYLPRGAGSGANRYIIPSGTVGTGTQAAPRFVTVSPTGGRGGAVLRIEKINTGGWPFEVRTPTGTVLHSFPSGTKGWCDLMFEKPSGAVFQLAGHADMF